MIIKDILTDKVYYNTGRDKTYFVTSEFWKKLKAGKIHYKGGGQEGKGNSIIYYSTRETLDLKDKNFEEEFEGIAKSEIGKLVMSGELPVTTIM